MILLIKPKFMSRSDMAMERIGQVPVADELAPRNG
jgi:hypothetical protein